MLRSTQASEDAFENIFPMNLVQQARGIVSSKGSSMCERPKVKQKEISGNRENVDMAELKRGQK